MRFTPLAEVAELTHKVCIEGIRGNVSQVGKQFSGTKQSDGTPWTKQDVELTDGTTTVTVRLWDKPLVAHTWKGHEVTVLAHNGDKGLSGVYAWDDEYKGKKSRQIKVTATGEIALLGSAPAAAPPPAQAPHPAAPAPPPQRNAPAQNAAPQANAANDIKKVRHFMMRQSNLRLLALDAAVYTAKLHNVKHPEFKLGAGDIRELSSVFFIGAERQGMGDWMPDSPIQSKEDDKK